MAEYGAMVAALGAGAAWLLLGVWGIHPPIAFLLAALAVAGGVGGVAGYRIGWDLRRRLRPLTQGVAIFAAGGLRHRVPVEGEDELAVLAEGVNAMAQRHAEQIEALQRLAGERSRLSGEAARAAVLEERQRLARDLHDAISQAIFSIAMMTAAARRLLATDPARAAAQMAEVEALASDTQRSMRALLLELRPVELAGRPLADALAGFVAEVGERYGLETAFERDGERNARIAPALEDGLFRIVQEALVNAVRHSGASRLTVRLTVRPTAVEVGVHDDGRGFDPGVAPPDAHYGLRSMHERALELGGSFDVVSAPGRGTAIEVSVPRLVPGA